jgi:hypothetical protein
LRTLIGTGSEQQQLDKELWGCLLAVRRGWKRRSLSLARAQCFISSSHTYELMYNHVYSWTWEMTIQTTRLQFKRKCLLLKLLFVFKTSCF